MSRVIQHPEIKRGGLRAVAFSQVDVSIYDDQVDPKREVWHGKTLEEADLFMDAALDYLDAFRADAHGRTPETKAALKATFERIPETGWKGRVLTIAFRRLRVN